ncbi:MAG: precorrin-3B C(17)-methyltransferase [Thermodesulfovibrionales bacterium]
MDIGDKNLPTTIFYITEKGLQLAQRLKGLYPVASIVKFNSSIIPEIWNISKNIIFIMAAGIVVRTIAPLIKNKKTDPAVVVLDEKGSYAISLLSGHLGGANELARRIADFLKAEAVITTSSDVNDLPSIDLWAKENGLVIENKELLPKIATRLLNNKSLNVYLDHEIDLPQEFKRVSQVELADMIITNRILGKGSRGGFQTRPYTLQRLILRPRNLVVGIGCNSGTSLTEIEDAIRDVLNEKGFSFLSINSVATIDRKSKEKGIIDFVTKYSLPLKFYTSEEINSLVASGPEYFNISEAAFSATGAHGVAEPAALLASGARELLISKQKIGNVTVAVAARRQKGSGKKQGRLYIIGTGPGGIGYITPRAIEAIEESEAIVGYKTYIELIKDLIKGKEIISTGMTQEIERAKKAVDLAMSGKTVSIISGGDPGIYGMAGLVLELLRSQNKEHRTQNKDEEGNLGSLFLALGSGVSVEVIPGISALNASASRLGAPLMHDFAVISLSDRLTEWSLIEKRLELSAKGDFVTVIYNPRSKGRQEHINRARDIFLRYRSTETPVGIVRGAMRHNEEVIITDLQGMLNYDIDMETTVIIGNSQTYVWNNWMITPRGYEKKMQRE